MAAAIRAADMPVRRDVSSAHRAFKAPSFKAPKMPHAAAPARNNAMRGQVTNQQATHGPREQRANTREQHPGPRQQHPGPRTPRQTRAIERHRGHDGYRDNQHRRATRRTPRSSTNSPYNYTYGTGTNARNYRAYGYGHGYRNRYYGRGYGYGRSQGNNRAIVARLRSVHSSLARIDHDYQGHRVRAMHSISMAIRQLSHRSMVSGNTGFANGMNNNLAMGRRQGGLNGNVGGRGTRTQNRNRNQRMPQAQSDAQMSQALRTLQGINMQLTSQGSNTSGHARASGHVQQAMRELNTALRIR